MEIFEDDSSTFEFDFSSNSIPLFFLSIEFTK